MSIKIPKVFISYSWDNEIHKHWVLDLATKLRRNQVDVILDIWELRAGKDKDFFMENSVRESDKVLLIMTPNYKVKAENRKGGVGNEISMIRAEKFNCQETEKFIPIVRLGDREECTPLFAKSLVDIDMSIDDNFEESFEELLRTIYEEPKHKKPLLGQKPLFTTPKKNFDLGIPDLIEESQLIGQKTIKKFDLKLDLKQNKNNNDILLLEISDPKEIAVSISAPVPIVILFGAVCTGKKMALIRLTRYLRMYGYKVEPDREFRNDNFYEIICDRFHEEVNSNTAASSHGNLGFMLLKVFNRNGEILCQILDAPGEHYFDVHREKVFPPYIYQIIHAKNPKIWIFIMELDWSDMKTRNTYAEKIAKTGSLISKKDKIILMCNKVDKHIHYFDRGRPIEKAFFEGIKNQYSLILEKFKNRNPTIKLFRQYDFDFVVFSAGVFTQSVDSRLIYTEGEDIYPATLWKAILRAI